MPGWHTSKRRQTAEIIGQIQGGILFPNLRKWTSHLAARAPISSAVRTPAAEDDRSGQTGATNSRLCLSVKYTFH